MVEDVEQLRVESQLHTLVERKPFGDVEVAPEEVGAAQSIAAEISELAVLSIVTAVASFGARIDSRDKRVWVEPLNRARLGNAGNVAVATVRIHPGYKAGELRPGALQDAAGLLRVLLAWRRVWRAQHREWQPAVPEHGAGNLPAIYGIAEAVAAHFDRQLVDVLGGEIMANVVIAGAVLAAKLARQRREKGSCSEWQESAV